MGRPRKEMQIGERFGRLIIIKEVKKRDNKICWECKCDCGQFCIVFGAHLRNGNTKSCGCFDKEKISKRFRQHGDALLNGHYKKLYQVWRAIKKRCSNLTDKNFYNYGARGIKLCKEWTISYICFKKWALKNGYRIGLQIDRKDNDGDYTPRNCRFVPSYINIQNSRVAKLTKKDVLKIRQLFLNKSDTKKSKEVAIFYGVTYGTIQNVISHRTWKNI